MSRMPRPTGPVGLYDPTYEHDACGVAFVARLSGDPTHETVQRAIMALENLEHRGAAGADPNTGDGAGILLQLPDELMRGLVGQDLPPPGAYGVCVCFLPKDEERRAEFEALLEGTVARRGPARRRLARHPGRQGLRRHHRQLLRALHQAARGRRRGRRSSDDQDAFERKLYVIRRMAELAAGPELVIPSFSSRTVVYKGMLTAPQLLGYYPDLQDTRTKSALALVHSRFSTNTFPSWELAHPYRMIAHNGEINTLRGNVNWMRARESQLASELFGDDLPKMLPIVRPGGSDSATFDNVLELLTLAGRSVPHAVMMMIPEAYEGRDDMPEDLKGFYAFHSCLMEPWDGPAAVAFTDGRVIGATLDRNGLRPGRWLETKDGWVVLGSETGVIDEPPENVAPQGPPAAGQHLPRRPRARPHRRGRRGQERDRLAPALRRVVRARHRAPRRPARPRARARAGPAAAPAPARLRLHAGGPQGPARADRGQGRGADRLDGQRPLAGRAERQPPAALLLLQAALRAGHQPADRPDPRGDRDERLDRRRLRAQPARRDARARPPARHGDADPAQPRAREAAPGRLRGLPRPHARHHVADRRGPGGHGARRSTACARRPTRRSPRAPTC